MLNLNLYARPKEVYLYISAEVERNILKPLVEKKQYITKGFCQSSGRIPIIHSCSDFRVYYHRGEHIPRTDIFFVVLKNPNIKTLTIFANQENNQIYYGIKNKTIQGYTDLSIKKIVQKYLL